MTDKQALKIVSRVDKLHSKIKELYDLRVELINELNANNYTIDYSECEIVGLPLYRDIKLYKKELGNG